MMAKSAGCLIKLSKNAGEKMDINSVSVEGTWEI
jgi:hypothetical protein